MNNKPDLAPDYACSEELAACLGTEADLLRSRAIQWRACERVAARFPWITATGSPGEKVALPFSLEVKTSPRSSVLQLQAWGPHPEATQAFLDALIVESLSLKRNARQKFSADALSTITAEIKDLETKMQRQQGRLAAFLESNNVPHLTEQGQKAGSYLAQLGQSLAGLRTECQWVETQLSDPSRPSGTALSAAQPLAACQENSPQPDLSNRHPRLEAGYYETLEKLHLLKSKRDGLSRYLRPTHSKMIQLERDLSGLEELLETFKKEEFEQAQAGLAGRRHSLDLQIRNLEGQYRAWETDAAEATRKLAAYDEMRQEIQRSQSLYDRLLNILQSVDLSKNLDTEPLTPLAPASPARPTHSEYKAAGLASAAALLLGLASILFLEFSAGHILTPDELRACLSLEVLGQIPERAADSALTPHCFRDEPRDAFGQAFRHLRASLFSGFETLSQPRIILVSSAAPQEGRTTIALNLAVAVAMAGRRVLLIDADFNGGSLHELFKVRKNPGWNDLLLKSSTLPETIVQTGCPGVDLLPRGEIQGSDSELCLDHHGAELLKELAQQYDCLVLDGGPVLGTGGVAGLGRLADGILMVVRAAFTPSPVIKTALEHLRLHRVRLLGSVFNRLSPSLDHFSRYLPSAPEHPQEKGSPGLTANRAYRG